MSTTVNYNASSTGELIPTPELPAEKSDNESTVVEFPFKGSYSESAIAKIACELESFNGGNKEKAVSKFVASTLTHFCKENERFAEVVFKTKKTLSDICEEVMKGCGNHISDIDVYRGAVKAYFPNSDIRFLMEIEIIGEPPTEEEMQKLPEKKAEKKAKKAEASPKPKKKTSNKSLAKTTKATEEKKPEILQLSLF